MPTIFPLRLISVARLFAAGVLSLGLTAAPITFNGATGDIASKAVFAKKGGDKGGGKDRGGGRDRGDRDRGDRGGKSDRSGGSGDRGKGIAGNHRSLSTTFDDVRSGRAFGFGQKDRRIERAKDRYGKGLVQKGNRSSRDLSTNPDGSRVAHRFTKKQTDELIGRGWKTDKSVDGFVNHGDRVRTMVALAKALGYDASVGALQANFGTPMENGIAALQDELAAAKAEAETDPDAALKVQELEAQLATAIESAKPGDEAAGDWATADLDVNDDGIVDRADLAALGDIQNEDDDDQTDIEDEVADDDENDETTVEASLN